MGAQILSRFGVFCIDPDGTIRLEALYAHRMNIVDRFFG